VVSHVEFQFDYNFSAYLSSKLDNRTLLEIHGHFYTASFGQRVHEPMDDHHVLVWLTAEEAMKQFCRRVRLGQVGKL
jgi:hypothetical protein